MHSSSRGCSATVYSHTRSVFLHVGDGKFKNTLLFVHFCFGIFKHSLIVTMHVVVILKFTLNVTMCGGWLYSNAFSVST